MCRCGGAVYHPNWGTCTPGVFGEPSVPVALVISVQVGATTSHGLERRQNRPSSAQTSSFRAAGRLASSRRGQPDTDIQQSRSLNIPSSKELVMTPDQLKVLLEDEKVEFEERPVQNGTQFRCSPGGEIFNVFDTGKITVQGKRTTLSDQIRTVAGDPVEAATPTQSPSEVAASSPSTTVFIVHGHDITARDSLELLLRRFGLNPIIIQQLPATGDTIIEKLEHYIGQQGDTGYACVLLTPDDEGHAAGLSEEMKYRARQNVVLELGMVLARLGRPRVAILHKESVELPSDISGLLYIPFKERIDEIKNRLFRELQAAGYKLNTDGLA